MTDNGSVGPTPGAWRTNPDCGHESVLGPNGAMVADCAIFGMSRLFQARGGSNVANARLIAAAPELAEALKELWLYAQGLEGVIRNGVYRSEELNDPNAWSACDDWAYNGEGASMRQQVESALQKAGLSAGEGC